MPDSATSPGFDPFGPAFLADPVSSYPALLKASPGYMNPDGVASAYVARHAHATGVLSDFKRFSSVRPPGVPGLDRLDFFNGQTVMAYADPPQHDRLRRVVGAAFAARQVCKSHGALADVLDELLNGLSERQEIEAVSELCLPMAIRFMLGHFLGLPDEAQKIFTDFGAALRLLADTPPGGGKPRAYLDAWNAGVGYCAQAAARARREEPGGVIGAIVAAHEGDRLSDAEMMAMMVLLMTAGYPTIAAAASACLKNLALHPEVTSQIRAEPELAERHFTESLRLDPPVTLVLRFAKQDTEIDGAPIAKGMPVYVMLAAACRDPGIFPNPERFEIGRDTPSSHLALGFGLHACIGNAVARICVVRFIQTMAERFPKLRRADRQAPLSYETSLRGRHLARLPLALR
jgi:cytochrome P450